MAYVVRTKDNPGDVGRAADQQQGVDNESALYAAVLGNGPVSTGGMVRQFVRKTGMADNTATEVFTVTTTNEAGNTDGGTWCFHFDGIAVHGVGAAGDNAVLALLMRGVRAMRSTGTGQLAVGAAIGAVLAESEGGATKGIVSCAMTMTETSEYVTSALFTVDIDGAAITTAEVYGMVTLYYSGFTTPPVITSAG